MQFSFLSAGISWHWYHVFQGLYPWDQAIITTQNKKGLFTSRTWQLHVHGALQERWRHNNHPISLTRVFRKHKSNITAAGKFRVFKLRRHSVDGKYLMNFQTEISFFKSFGVECTEPERVTLMIFFFTVYYLTG